MNYDPSFTPEDSYEQGQVEQFLADAIKNSHEAWERLPQIQCFIGPTGNGKGILLTRSIEHYVNTSRRELINLNRAMDSIGECLIGHEGHVSMQRRFVPHLLAASRDGGFYGNPEYHIYFDEIPHYVSELRDALGEHKKLFCTSFNETFINCLLPSEVFYCAPVKKIVEQTPTGAQAGEFIASMPIEKLARFDTLFAEGYTNTQIIKKIGRDEIIAQLKAESGR